MDFESVEITRIDEWNQRNVLAELYFIKRKLSRECDYYMNYDYHMMTFYCNLCSISFFSYNGFSLITVADCIQWNKTKCRYELAQSENSSNVIDGKMWSKTIPYLSIKPMGVVDFIHRLWKNFIEWISYSSRSFFKLFCHFMYC